MDQLLSQFLSNRNATTHASRWPSVTQGNIKFADDRTTLFPFSNCDGFDLFTKKPHTHRF
jgi:hypothetical protein